MRRQRAMVVVHIHAHGQAELTEIIVAGDSLARLFGLAQGRQQHRRQNGDDGDDHKQFDQRERALLTTWFIFSVNHFKL